MDWLAKVLSCLSRYLFAYASKKDDEETKFSYDLVAHCDRAIAFSRKTFGNHSTPESMSKHIQKELEEIAAKPDDLEEWIDVIILAIDGANRFAGGTGESIAKQLLAKQEKNESRKWPDPLTVKPGEPILHIKEGEAS